MKRALIKLDLLSKSLGLVPQAQKIEVRTIQQLSDFQKTIPSLLPFLVRTNTASAKSQAALQKMLEASVRVSGTGIEITDITGFKYSITKVNPSVVLLKKIAGLLIASADCLENGRSLAHYGHLFAFNPAA